MKGICVFLIVLVAALAEEIQVDRGVLVLNKDNFQEALDTHDLLLVEFYAPWCGHCKALEPEYVKAAETLQELESPVRLAKVDATEQKELANQYEIRRYPTLKFFRSGQSSDFKGGRVADDIVKALLKKSDPETAAPRISSVDQVKELAEKEQVVALGVFGDLGSDQAKAFYAVAQDNDDVKFAVSTSEEVGAEYGIPLDTVLVLKKFDDGKAVLEGDLTYERISQFVATESVPLVIEMNRSNSHIFRGDIKNHVLFFIRKNAGSAAAIIDAARKVAKDFRGQVVFLSVDVDDEDNQRLRDFFGVKEDQAPTTRIIQIGGDNLKYKLDDDFSEEYIRSAVQDYLDGKMKPHYLEQELPEDWDKHPVKVLVASNFDSVALDKTKDVLVEFYAPWCGHCQKLAPIYEELAQKFEANPSVVVAKMDGTLNELEHVKLRGFPTIRLYKKATNEAVEYTGQRTLEALTQFLEEQTKETSQEETMENVKEEL